MLPKRIAETDLAVQSKMSKHFKSILNGSVPISLLFLLLLVTIRAGGVELFQTEPVVCISDGCLRGTVLQNSVGSSYPAFLGIPFAKPPIGKLRFAVRQCTA